MIMPLEKIEDLWIKSVIYMLVQVKKSRVNHTRWSAGLRDKTSLRGSRYKIYTTKVNLKRATENDTSTLESKTDSASLKTKEGDLDVEKLKTVSAYLSMLSNIVDNDGAKKTVYDQLVIKVNAIGTKITNASGLVTKAQYDSYKQDPQKKIKDIDKKFKLVVWSRRLTKTQD